MRVELPLMNQDEAVAMLLNQANIEADSGNSAVNLAGWRRLPPSRVFAIQCAAGSGSKPGGAAMTTDKRINSTQMTLTNKCSDWKGA